MFAYAAVLLLSAVLLRYDPVLLQRRSTRVGSGLPRRFFTVGGSEPDVGTGAERAIEALRLEHGVGGRRGQTQAQMGGTDT